MLDLAMCASSLGSYFIVKSAKNNIIPLNKAHYVYTLWILTWTISFLSKAYKYEWSWVCNILLPILSALIETAYRSRY